MAQFKLSESLRELVIDALITRIVEAIQLDEETARSMVEHGFPSIGDMDGDQLMDEYMSWHGAFSEEESPDDKLLRRMFEEFNSYQFEQQVLTQSPQTPPTHSVSRSS